jgi:hypothetical protein
MHENLKIKFSCLRIIIIKDNYSTFEIKPVKLRYLYHNRYNKTHNHCHGLNRVCTKFVQIVADPKHTLIVATDDLKKNFIVEML